VELALRVPVDVTPRGRLDPERDLGPRPGTQTFSFSLTVVNDTTEDQITGDWRGPAG
jgi:hypothetical protein